MPRLLCTMLLSFFSLKASSCKEKMDEDFRNNAETNDMTENNVTGNATPSIFDKTSMNLYFNAGEV